ncbi:AbrB/MazE/SpoVT family DNA-binding domain-containing protein [Azospirillum brasilense]|uniref:AbrB/MazE/SpoVT family DNA-binding domain-containing protein n=2 Tax=Azospirillum TaxID=191 RepID=A0A0P0F0L8_AZOBR|nr:MULTISPECIES: AbrB/MazE/SpoVT family DNA-binding domain-containing protein [Azospirillum]ALJ34004.1 AbrB family transcriptional regulator [Azospirillum brasilense]AWJ88479.1 AbrB/MazE/SpoVT family DNA-binding domain-containing protein [Azospirillum baldaniorum]MDW7553033.1 AbrB/MazE/SpoVT family DNA-binding domain-containing protein [Azospirillum brasilense]MDW7591775.1 AbrB/MazE/SpoVT family DNA-binding domain-containing protein [Azospirillum brasilense]MDW7627948.1 AbrB/MazE/SpoVT family 
MHTTKLTKVGNSTGLTLPRDVLAAADLQRGDAVSVEVRDGRIEISKTDDSYNRAMDIGRRFSARYRRTMDILSK